MKKLTYTDDQQIINDAAQMLIESNLDWSGSLKNMPSKDLNGVSSMMMDAILEAKYTYEEWDALTKPERELEELEVHAMFKKAAQIADRKWEAAKTLLGIEE